MVKTQATTYLCFSRRGVHCVGACIGVRVLHAWWACCFSRGQSPLLAFGRRLAFGQHRTFHIARLRDAKEIGIWSSVQWACQEGGLSILVAFRKVRNSWYQAVRTSDQSLQLRNSEEGDSFFFTDLKRWIVSLCWRIRWTTKESRGFGFG